jgi:hypothetical protein
MFQTKDSRKTPQDCGIQGRNPFFIKAMFQTLKRAGLVEKVFPDNPGRNPFFIKAMFQTR